MKNRRPIYRETDLEYEIDKDVIIRLDLSYCFSIACSLQYVHHQYQSSQPPQQDEL